MSAQPKSSQRVIERHEVIDSTMRRAVELARAGCASGTVVVAEQQTAGQGRYGRSWHSAPGDGLYMSIALRLNLTMEDLPVITLALGLATAAAIENVTGVNVDLRWPNDVMIDDKKVAGILTQLHDDAVVAGIGVNLNHEGFPEEISDIAISLRMASGRGVSAEALLPELLNSIDEHCAVLGTRGRAAIFDLFTHASSYVSGRRVEVDLGPETITGVTEGINANGFLVVRGDDGTRTTVVAGGVRPVN